MRSLTWENKVYELRQPSRAAAAASAQCQAVEALAISLESKQRESGDQPNDLTTTSPNVFTEAAHGFRP
jgi:hypothetical protein